MGSEANARAFAEANGGEFLGRLPEDTGRGVFWCLKHQRRFDRHLLWTRRDLATWCEECRVEEKAATDAELARRIVEERGGVFHGVVVEPRKAGGHEYRARYTCPAGHPNRPLVLELGRGKWCKACNASVNAASTYERPIIICGIEYRNLKDAASRAKLPYYTVLRRKNAGWPEHLWLSPVGTTRSRPGRRKVDNPAGPPKPKASMTGPPEPRSKAFRHDGIDYASFKDFSERHGLPPHIVKQRRARGWPMELWASPLGTFYNERGRPKG